MAAGRSPSFCCLVLTVGVFVFVSADQKTVTAESAQNVTLPCRAPNNNIIVVKWSRTDLGTDYVLYYRDERFDSENQHLSFKNRVDLQDRQMKDGDVSVILKNVTINDTGTYECHVVQGVRQPMKLISTTYLHVDPPGNTGGSVGLIVGLTVFAVLLVAAAVGFLIYRKQKKTKSQDPYQPSDELQHV